MSQFKELHNPLSPQYLQLKQHIFHHQTVWNRHDTHPLDPDRKYDHPWWTHLLLARSCDEFPYSVPMSSLCQLAAHVCKDILNANNMQVETFHRMSVNLLPRQSEHVRPGPHNDHGFDYKHMIIYLNDSDGDTIMFNKKGQVIDKSSPKEDKVISFGRCLHTGDFPRQHAERIILVATYS